MTVTAARSAAPTVDLFDPAFHRDPYPRYARAREAAAVCPGPHGMSVLTRHREVAAALRDPRLGHGPGDASTRLFSFLGLDEPDHAPLRRIASRRLSPQAIQALAPGITATVDELLDGVLQQREPDLLRDFAYPLSLRVICGLLGFPREDEPWIQAISPPLGRLLDPPCSLGPEARAAARTAAGRLAAYLRARIGERRREPGTDLISELVAEPALDRRDLLPMCALLLLAGFETTANVIATAAAALLAHPGQHAEARGLVRDGRLDRSALEELIRYDPSVQITFRTVLRPLTVAGHALPVGGRVALLLGSANRDPRVFARPDRIDLGRNPNPHLAFGAGPHYCLGGPLAKLEASIALGRLLERTRTLEPVAGPVRSRSLSATLRGLVALPAALTPR